MFHPACLEKTIDPFDELERRLYAVAVTPEASKSDLVASLIDVGAEKRRLKEEFDRRLAALEEAMADAYRWERPEPPAKRASKATAPRRRRPQTRG